jgi:hypothetical protein
VSQSSIDLYLEQLDRALRVRHVWDGEIVDELRAHLADVCAAARRDGLSVADAEREAIRRLGAAEVVAAAFVDGRRPMLNRVLVAVCALTVLAVGTLTLSVVVLRPPRVNYVVSGLLAFIVVAQSAVTIGAVMTSARSWLRLALSIGGALLVAVGTMILHETLSRSHFEGYALVVGTLVVVQGVLTIVHSSRGDGRRALMRRV